MPLKNFICTDNAKIPVAECLKEGGCRLGDRCASRSYLRLVAKERVWTGKPSTTQLIQGTMQAFLKLTKDYSVSPDARAFMLHGTKAHAILEESEDEYSILEESFRGDDVDETGISDCLECEKGKITLSDYKTSGSYKVKKALGFVVIKEDTGEVYKTGPRKGEPKMRNVLVRRDEDIDRLEWELQLNKYRIEAERKLSAIFAKKGIKVPEGKKIDELRIQCCVRDGNTYIARSRGVFRNIYYFQISKIPDKEILYYFKRKRLALERAITTGTWTQYCSKKESWDGLKCSKYCEVAEYCPLGQMYKKEEEDKDMAIKGVSEIRRLPRVGKIRLGITVSKNGVEYPKEVDYFIPDPETPVPEENERIVQEFKKLYGNEPKQINIMFPVGDLEVVFSQWWKRYGKTTSLQCKGDGETAICTQKEYAAGLEVVEQTETGLARVKCMGKECPYTKKRQCAMNGTLQILLPEIPGAGVWQISTGSFNSIVNLNGCLEYIRAVCGRIHMIPLKLERREQEIPDPVTKKVRKHYTLHLNMSVRLKDLQQYALIKPEQIMLELPEPAADKKDILLQEHESIETAEIKTPPKIADNAGLDAMHKKSLAVATEIYERLDAAKTMGEFNKIILETQSSRKDLMQEHKEWLVDEEESIRTKIKELL